MKRFEKMKAYLAFMLLLAVFSMLPGCGNGTFGGGHWDKPHYPVISAYSLAGIAGTINETAKTIAVTVPYGTDVSTLVANYTTTATSVKVGTTLQSNGATANNFTSPVVYNLTGADNSASEYTVIVTAALNSAKAITAYSFAGYPAFPGTINELAKTIAVNLPFGTPLSALTANFTTTGTTMKIGSAVQTSGTTANSFITSQTYRVTAADGTFADYIVSVTVAPNFAKAITAYSYVGFSSFPGTINELAKTITVNLPSGTDVRTLTANFTTTGTGAKIGTVDQTSGGAPTNDFTTPKTYRVTAADGSIADYAVIVNVAPPLSTAKAITAYSFVGLPGSPGNINEAAKTITVTLPSGTDVRALTANFTTTGTGVKIGSIVQTSGGAPTNDFTTSKTYRVTAADGSTSDYAVTVTIAPALSSAKAITAYSFVGLTGSPGTVNEAAKTIAVNLPSGTDVRTLTANFTTTGTGVKIGTAVQTSGGAPTNDFTTPKTYRVTAADGSTADYVVSVTMTPALSSAKAITTYSFVGYLTAPVIINEAAKTIAVTLPLGTDVQTLTANFTTTGTGVKIGTAVQTSGGVPTNDFTTSKTYRVTAADGSTADYIVTVTLGSVIPQGPPPIELGLAKNFAGLSKSGITNVPSSAITGSIGASPISGSFIGVTCAEVTGTIYSVDAAGPAPCSVVDPVMLTTAVSNLETAYTDAAGRPAGVGPNLNLGAGTVAGQTLVPGTYTWGTGVTITTDLTLNGGPNDVWLFQITGTLDLSPNMKIILTGGAKPENIFWQVAGAVTLLTGSHFEGSILAKTNIAMQTGASINGRLLAQTGVSLQQNAITIPVP